MTEIELQKYISSVLQSALKTDGETSSLNGYSISVKLDEYTGQGHFDFIPTYPVKYAVDKKLNGEILGILSGALYPFFTLFAGGPNFVSTNLPLTRARALRFYFKVGTYSRKKVSIDESYIYSDFLPIMSGFDYDFKHNSGHVAITGSSGSGKTVMVEYLLSQFWLIGAKIIIIDPKLDRNLWSFASSRGIEYHYPKVDSNPNAFDNETLDVLSKAVKKIGERQSHFLKNKSATFTPYIIFVDEAAAYSSKASRELMEKIVLMGRACRVWLFVSAQSMDATSVLSSTARDSMGLRMILSANPSAEDCRYLMKGFDPNDIVIPHDEYSFGLGLIEQKSDGRVTPLLAPYIQNLE